MASNLPPGCTNRMIDEQAGVYDDCAVCRKPCDDCICPECPVCHSHGDPDCYKRHGIEMNTEQLISRTQANIADLRERIAEEEMYIEYLQAQARENWGL